MGKIRIRNLLVPTVIGTYAEEREAPQEIRISIEVEVDDEAGMTDDIAYALDYEALCRTIDEQVSASSFYLIERLAAFVLDLVLQHPQALHATVCVSKPGAIEGAETVEYEISNRL